jgi:peptidoglycan/xylan/chitin deacetylase (PgdA/CDA1 family)
VKAGVPRSIPILTYHQVGHFSPDTVRRQRGNYVDAARFREQVRLLRTLGYSAVTLSQLSAWLAGGESLPRRPIVFTFDDAYQNVFQHAFPVLREVGWTATTFVVTSQLSGRNEWDLVKGIKPAALMTPAQITTLRLSGWEVGAHSRSHTRLNGLEPQALRHEIRGSQLDVAQLTGEVPHSWCYPYGDLDDQAVSAVQDAGFTAAVTLRRGVVRRNSDPLRLRRLHVGYRQRLPHFLFRLESARLLGAG